jgi:hypothetical protein
VIGDESIDALGSDRRYTVRVEVTTSDGRTLTGEASDRPGGPTRPMSKEMVQRKFTSLVTPLLGRESTERLQRTVEELDVLDDVATLVAQTRLGHGKN